MKPWVKLWRPQPGSTFDADVSSPARFFFRGLLAEVDDSGTLAISTKGEDWDALGRAVGYPAKERRPVKRYLAELVDHGCIRVDAGTAGRRLIMVSFDEWQLRKGRVSGSVSGADMTGQEETLTGQDRALTDQDGAMRAQEIPGHGNDMGVTPRNHSPDLPEERERETRQRSDTPLTPQRDDEPRSFWPLTRGYSGRYEQATGSPWMAHAANEREIRQVARWLDAADVKLDVWLDAWFRDAWARDHRWPWKHAAKNPDRFLAQPTSGPGQPADVTGRPPVTETDDYLQMEADIAAAEAREAERRGSQ